MGGRDVRLTEINIGEVWQALGGRALRGRRGNAFWRDGDSYSVSLDVAKGTWFDFRDARGGGSLALVETALGCDRRTALQWLEANCGLDPTQSLSPGEHRKHRQELDNTEYFGIAAKALAEELLDRLDACDSARLGPTRLLRAVRTGGAALINEYRIWLDRNPELTRAMVSAGASSAARLRRRLAFYVVELANAA
jgi:hypothetical protein